MVVLGGGAVSYERDTPGLGGAAVTPREAGQEGDRYSSQFENNCFTEMCSGCEAGSYLRLIDFVYHLTLGLRVKTRRKKEEGEEGGWTLFIEATAPP